MSRRITRSAAISSACLAAWFAAAQPKRITDEVRAHANVAVPMRDGVRLLAEVYRPARAGRHPGIVVRTPYGKQREGIHRDLIAFAQRGRAVGVQDTRGRFESEGEWDPLRYEARDGYDTIEWAARRE